VHIDNIDGVTQRDLLEINSYFPVAQIFLGGRSWRRGERLSGPNWLGVMLIAGGAVLTRLVRMTESMDAQAGSQRTSARGSAIFLALMLGKWGATRANRRRSVNPEEFDPGTAVQTGAVARSLGETAEEPAPALGFREAG
jgi:hypothetical protein